MNMQHLAWLLKLSASQMAAVREVDMIFFGDNRECATASAVLFTFICGRLPTLQRLCLHQGHTTEYKQKYYAEVGCTSDT